MAGFRSLFIVCCALFSGSLAHAKLSPTPLPRPVFKDATIKLVAVADQDFSQDLQALLEDPTGTGFTFTATGGAPSWIKIDNTTHLMTGHPTPSNAGVVSFQMNVTNSDELGDIMHPTQMTVLVGPKWKVSPLDLGQQHEGSAFTYNLSTQVSNPSGMSLTYSTTGTKPAWLNVSSDGHITGTPARKDVGKYSGFSFVVTDTSSGFSLSATTPGQGEVLITYVPPSWTGNPITLPDVNEDSTVSQSVTKYVNNPEGGPLTFELINPPAWISISPSGTLNRYSTCC